MFGSAVKLLTEPMHAELSDDVWQRVAPFLCTVNLAATTDLCRVLKGAMTLLLDLRKRMCDCGCLIRLRDREADFPVFAQHGNSPAWQFDWDNTGRPQELFPGRTVRINCIWHR